MTKNITLSIDEAVLAEARVVAAKHGTTVNAMVRTYLEDVAHYGEDEDMARVRLRELMEASNDRTGQRAATRPQNAVGQVSTAPHAADEPVSANDETTKMPALSSHETMVRIAEEGNRRYADNPLSREAVNDRDYSRALNYLENRVRLLKRIDETKGDMGKQRWNREALYER